MIYKLKRQDIYLSLKMMKLVIIKNQMIYLNLFHRKIKILIIRIGNSN